ncbi:OsmC family protein [Sporolactobacillus pectinivorans]|uniref:OsmC family protein n=1 Tax=Sporolactobacillus pectinivorans TaxID=1591408 RepID=UPI000C263273|nr:OsmC family protein [Sporolactobacillus pectinivorans]
MERFTFNLKGNWKGSWDGQGHVKTKGIDTDISVDPSMKGAGIGTNPDELLLSALSSCYMITLGIRLGKEEISFDHLSIESEGIVTKKGGLHFDKVIHRPVIFLDREVTDESKLRSAIYQAEQDCMVAKAVRGNVRIEIAPVFKTVETDPGSKKA